jgi:YjbE family integral membrane protein
MDFGNTEFWLGLLQIIGINIVLSGDNAVVIALAARSLPKEQQRQAIIWGTAGAVVLRVLLTLVAAKLMALPWLQIVGGALLLWIGVQLLAGGDDEAESDGKQVGLFAAIRTILIADLVMSLDNVIGVAAAAKGDSMLLIIGLGIAIPIVIFGSTLMIKLMERFPVIVTAGAALIGWVAGDTIFSDTVVKPLAGDSNVAHYAFAVAGAVFVVLLGKWLASRNTKAEPAVAGG